MNKQGVLPLLISPKDAASFSHSVLPFYSSALRYFSSLHHGTWDIYSTTSPFVFGTGFSIASSLTVFILSQITGNWSWYSIPLIWCIVSNRVVIQGRSTMVPSPCILRLSLYCLCGSTRPSFSASSIINRVAIGVGSTTNLQLLEEGRLFSVIIIKLLQITYGDVVVPKTTAGYMFEI